MQTFNIQHHVFIAKKQNIPQHQQHQIAEILELKDLKYSHLVDDILSGWSTNNQNETKTKRKHQNR